MDDENKITIEEIIKTIKKYNPKSDSKLIRRAYEYAKKYHAGQERKSGEPYIIHPVEVVKILIELELDDQTMCATLLHDLIEDTVVTYKDIEIEFGKDIAEMVEGVTKLGRLQYTTKVEEEAENFRKMFMAMGKDIRIIIIKLADRLHNMRTLKYLSRERQYEISKETIEIYAPLANRLGIYSLKWELEDLCFRYLYPEDFYDIVEKIKEKREERERFINQIIEEIRINLKKAKIEAEVTGRPKHFYSIYKKMQRDNKTLDQIYDIYALRIFINSVKDCYASLGIVHDLYKPMPGRFKDYISVPKPNMYQSLHTTLIGSGGTPFEIQIRTWDMHRIAEYGIAAHWAYKEGKKLQSDSDDKLSWLRESLEWQKETQDPNVFMKSLKTDLFEDEVFVFTPRGEIKSLPTGSCSIDFAYIIHQQIGHRMTGCKINSKMMPITTKLKNGDIIEIITSDSSKGPSRDWLKFVKSTQAKNKIQQWFKKEQREENIVKGKESVERELKRIGFIHADLFKQNWIEIVLERYKYNTLEDMYSSIGFGAISPAKIISRLLEEYRKEHKEEQIEQKLEELKRVKPITTKPSKTGVVVKGIDNCLVKLSKCCNPLPGDDIIGYITKGRGVSVHRSDCVNTKELIQEEGKLIDVYWTDETKASYIADIDIYANDRAGLLVDIIAIISGTKTKLIAVNSRANKERIAFTEVSVEVTDTNDLNDVLKALRKVDSVYEVRRRK